MKNKVLAGLGVVLVLGLVIFTLSKVQSKKIDVSNSKAEEFITYVPTEEETESITEESSSLTDEEYNAIVAPAETAEAVSETRPTEPAEREIGIDGNPQAVQSWEGVGIIDTDFDVEDTLSKNTSNRQSVSDNSEESSVFSLGTMDNPCVYLSRYKDNPIAKEKMRTFYDYSFDDLYNLVYNKFGDDGGMQILTEFLNIYVRTEGEFFIYDYKEVDDAIYVVILRLRDYHHFAIVKDEGEYKLLNYATIDWFNSSLQELEIMDPAEGFE